MNTLTVALGDRSYPIHIGSRILADQQLLIPHIKGNQVLIVTNETVAPLYLEKAQSALGNFETETVILPDGEKYKTLEITRRIFTHLLEKHFNRTATLIALGGGVVGDITGFAAACYQRGVNFIQIPTTLLAQVDSSVGGKTGVNHPLGKNMIGAFHQPQCVITDIDTLNTLDNRQLNAGIAEIIKYGLIRDYEFFEWLEDNIEKLIQRDKDALIYAINRSCMNKAEVVAADEKESGQRALLNLGHTFGHAIETGTGYGTWLHGEAIASGMLMAADLSARHGWLSSHELARIKSILLRASLPTGTPAELSAQQFLDLMSVDKKVLAGKLRFVLLKAIGKSFVTEEFEQSHLEELLNETPGINSADLKIRND
ncbi:MAG TPA: 3-dehydroquinate synthase [Gammaproteobacteria bacterium]|nr:3-dehydroquinate synthase [Gammaproteobacteria bacterium]